MEQADVGEVVGSSILRGRHPFVPVTAAAVAVALVLSLVGLQLGLRSVEARSTVGTLPERAGAAEFDPAGPSPVAEPPRSTPNPTPDDRSAPSVPPSAPDEIEQVRRSPSVAGGPEAEPEPDPSPDTSPNGRGQVALSSISYPWKEKLPEWTIEFLDERSGLLGLTLVEERRIEIYIRPGQPDDLLVHIVAHEIGHAVDVSLNDGPDRRRWQGARGIEDEPWWPNDAASDFSTGAGDFAESFAYWQVRSDNYRSKLGPAPTPSQLALMAELAAG